MIVGPRSTKLPQSWDTGSDQPAILIPVLQFLTDVAIYISLLTIEGKGPLPIHFILRWLWQWFFSLFFESFHRPIRVRCN